MEFGNTTLADHSCIPMALRYVCLVLSSIQTALHSRCGIEVYLLTGASTIIACIENPGTIKQI